MKIPRDLSGTISSMCFAGTGAIESSIRKAATSFWTPKSPLINVWKSLPTKTFASER